MTNIQKYKAIQVLINSGQVQSFTELFSMLPVSRVHRDTGISWYRMQNIVDNPHIATLEEIIIIGHHLGVEPKKLMALAWEQTERKLNGGK